MVGSVCHSVRTLSNSGTEHLWNKLGVTALQKPICMVIGDQSHAFGYGWWQRIKLNGSWWGSGHVIVCRVRMYSNKKNQITSAYGEDCMNSVIENLKCRNLGGQMRTRHLPLRKCRSTVNNFIRKFSELHCHEGSVQLLPYIHKALHTKLLCATS